MASPFKIMTFVLTIVLFCRGFIYSQNATSNYTVSGFVTTSQNEKLTDVNFYLKGTTTGTVTNEYGYYNLKVPEGENTIVFSFIGYQTQTHQVTMSKTLNVILVPNEEMRHYLFLT